MNVRLIGNYFSDRRLHSNSNYFFRETVYLFDTDSHHSTVWKNTIKRDHAEKFP